MGGACEAPSELYARDTDGRGAGSHSPFLSLPPAYPSLASGRNGKNERGEKPFGNRCEFEGERKRKQRKKLWIFRYEDICVQW